MNLLICIFIIIMFLALLIVKVISRSKEMYLPYKSKYILTKTEYAFYNILRPITDKHDCIICPKVGLKDMVTVTDKQNYMKWFYKINQKHIDFLICDCDLRPIFAIELDDKSHERAEAQINDNFKNSLFSKIELPLIRINVGCYDNLERILFPR